ncbi:MAG: hypothetical protein OHK0039_15100 [Bacteroidia bacterium]
MYAPLSAPPRQLPIQTRLVVLFSGIVQQMGWGFFAFGMIFFWVFFMQSEAKYWFSFTRWEQTQGTIAAITPTNAAVNDDLMYKVRFTYEVAGQPYEADSYVAGLAYSPDEAVPVEYDAGSPAVARVAGTQREIFPGFVAFVLIFPLVGLIMAVVSMRNNMRSLDLIANGKAARGRLISKEPTNTRINEQMVYAYTFAFEAEEDGQTYHAKAKTHIRSLLEDEDQELLIYAPAQPSYAVMYDAIPGAPQIDVHGYFVPVPVVRMWVLLLPVVAFFMSGGGYLVRLLIQEAM